MKKTDIAMIILIASIAAMIAFVAGSKLEFLAPPKQGAKVRVVDEVSSSVTEPSKEIFNAEAINPTVQTVIGRDAQ